MTVSGEKNWDVVIVGAGPSGFMAAITCAREGVRVLLLDAKETIGAKILISGGGRCNISSLKAEEKDYRTGAPRTVRNILRAFPSNRTLDFFKELGVDMVLEEKTKYFPKAQSAKFVLQALVRAAEDAGVVVAKGKRVRTVSFRDGRFQITGSDFTYAAQAVVIATGGLSYPETGSDGSGYALASSFGHSIVPTAPALAPLMTNDSDWTGLAGITLPVKLSIVTNGKSVAQSHGPLLLTHTGFSGPAVLDISGSWMRCEEEDKKLIGDFLPDLGEAALLASLEKNAAEHSSRTWKRVLALYLPERLAEVLLKKSGIDPKARFDQIPKKEKNAFFRSLFHWPLPVAGAFGYEKAEVTSGGVDLNEVDAKTLESKRCPGLFFAGEILDVDGRIGGFNFQWAWASGAVAGRSIAAKFRPRL